MSVADAMATNGMKEMGYEYINLDGRSLSHPTAACDQFYLNTSDSDQ